MRVLITGGLGVNGAVTARLMAQDGLRPVLMDNRMDLTLMGDIKDQVDIVIGDICDQGTLEKAVDDYKITHIAHLAALMPEPAEANPRLGVRVGADGTTNVLEVARAKKIERVVFTSSKAAYGEITGEYAPPTCKPVREDYPKQPADLYGSIKVCCEELGRYYRETYGIEFIALRFVSIYGPGKEARHGPLSFYGQLIEKARSGEKWAIPQGGDQTTTRYMSAMWRVRFISPSRRRRREIGLLTSAQVELGHREIFSMLRQSFFLIIESSSVRVRASSAAANRVTVSSTFPPRKRTSVMSRRTMSNGACAITWRRSSGWDDSDRDN